MSKIIQLDESVYSKIAAGEVIERPASVVKELVDNSIDANATEIIIKITEGGLKSIVVSDDGQGITRDDLFLSLSKHATSKIKSINDLLHIKTMGFRGEALHSIQSVSKFTISSNTDASGKSTGYLLSNHGENANQITSIACKKGTKVEVNELFYNLPARRKFLKSELSEWNAIKKTVISLALSSTHIRFQLFHNDKIFFSTHGDGDFENTFFSIYNKDTSFSINKYEETIDEDTTIIIYYSQDSVFFSNRKYQSFYVNNRPVNAPFFYSAIDVGIKNYISPGRYPFIFIFLTVDLSSIDINVHPAKKEIKFFYQNKVFALLQASIAKAYNKKLSRQIFASNHSLDCIQKKQPISTQKNLFLEQNDMQSYFDDVIVDQSNIYKSKNYNVIGTVFDTYIIIEQDEKVFFIDQHAAQEAIIYKRIKERLKENYQFESLIIPAIVELEDISKTLHDRINLLTSNGFDVEIGEGSTIIIRKIPSFILQKKDYDAAVDVIVEFLIKPGVFDIQNMNNELIATTACKSAIKKGDKLTIVEIAELVDEYFEKNITNCPHGRPTHFILEKNNLEKMFQRKK